MVSVGNNNTCKGERDKREQKEEREVWREIKKRREEERREEEERNSSYDYKSSIIKREISDLALENKLED